MTTLQTARFSIPLLATGQAHKELFHNEALTLLDFLIHPAVIEIVDDPDALTPSIGDSWLIGPAPVGDWSDHADDIAGWSDGGWRYIKPKESMIVFHGDAGNSLIFNGNGWQATSGVENPTGGQTIDVEARAAIESILTALKIHNVLPF
jgi:hypothetical protein